MFALQWEVSLFIVIEDDFCPAPGVVAAITFFTELALVYILYLMTADAALWCVFIFLV